MQGEAGEEIAGAILEMMSRYSDVLNLEIVASDAHTIKQLVVL